MEFPIFELPWEVKLVEVTYEVGSYIIHKQSNEQSMQDFLKDLIFGDTSNTEFLVQRAAYYGYNLKSQSQVVVVRINNLEEYILDKYDDTERGIVSLKERFLQVVLDVISHYHVAPLYLLWLDSLILLLPVKKQSKIDINTKIAAEFIEQLSRRLPKLVTNVGIGSSCTGPVEIRKSLYQAEQSLKFGIANGGNSVFAYDQMGVEQIDFCSK